MMKHQYNQRVHLTHPKFLTTTWLLATLPLLWATLVWATDIPPAWRDALQETGTARVIVVLNVPVQPEGTLNDADAIVAQRADIAQAQQLLLDSLQPQGSAETRLETIPALVMVVDNQTLTQLENNPLVARLQLDAADEAMAGQTVADQLKELERVYESSHSYAEVTEVTVSPASAQAGDVRELMVANLQSVGIAVARGEESSAGRQVRAANPGMPVASCGGVTAGLVACYPFDGDAKDYSGNGHNGVVQGGLNYTDGVSNKAASFNGATKVLFPSMGSNYFAGDFSINFYLKSSLGQLSVLAKRTSCAIGNFFDIRGGNGSIQFETYTLTPRATSYSMGKIVPNQWNFVTVMRNGTNAIVYINGLMTDQKTAGSILDNTAVLGIVCLDNQV